MKDVASSRRRGLAGVLLLVLLAVGIITLLYFGKWGSKSYVETTLDAREHASEVTAGVNLSSVYRSLQIYALGHDGKYPETPEELMIEANLPKGYVQLPSKPDQESLTVYIGGQGESMPASNILIYESVLDGDGMCTVLRVDGTVERFSAEQVQVAVAETRGYIAKRGR